MLFSLKYHVPSRGITGQNVIWRIYKNIDKGHTDTEYVESVKIINCYSHTGEDHYRVGYSLIVEGDTLEVITDPNTGLKTGIIRGNNKNKESV